MLASFYVLNEGDLERLFDCAVPETNWLGKAVDHFPETFEKVARKIGDYEAQGFVLGTVLVYLHQKRNVDLQSEHDESAQRLSATRNATYVVLTRRHAERYMRVLLTADYDALEMAAFFDDFNSRRTEDAQALGRALTNGVKCIAATLAAIQPGEIGLLVIG